MTIIVCFADLIRMIFYFHVLKKHLGYRILCFDKFAWAGGIVKMKSFMNKPNFDLVKTNGCDCEIVFFMYEVE